MTNFQTIVVLALVIILIVVLVNGDLLEKIVIKIRGRTEQVVRDDAATTTGASDYFNNAILEKEKLLQNAERSFAEIAGKLEESEKSQYLLKKEMMSIDKEINAALDEDNEEKAKTYAMKKATANQKIEVMKTTIEELKTAKEQQDSIRKSIKAELDALKEEKERTLFQMEADQQIIALHEGMNTDASSNESDKMLERVREGAKKTRERAAGSQIAYETSDTAQNRRLENESREREAQEILDSFKRQRGNS